MIRSLFLPAVISLSALGAVAITSGGTPSAIPALLVAWFLFACPGLAYVGLFRFGRPYLVPGLAVAVSLAMDMVVAEALLFTHNWSAPFGVMILASISMIGAALQVISRLRLGARRDVADTV